jgi:hypothetical protein
MRIVGKTFLALTVAAGLLTGCASAPRASIPGETAQSVADRAAYCATATVPAGGVCPDQPRGSSGPGDCTTMTMRWVNGALQLLGSLPPPYGAGIVSNGDLGTPCP